MAYYATRSFNLTAEVCEHQLLKFGNKNARDGFCDNIGGKAIASPEAKKLMIADVWHTARSVEADCIFRFARYIP